MKKTGRVLLSLLIIVFYILSFSACQTNPKFEFSVETENTTVISGESFRVQVHTKNVGSPYRYRGSSTKIGAEPIIYIEAPQGKVYLEHEPVPVTEDMAHVVIESNEIIAYEWVFLTDANTMKGTYTLNVTYMGDALTISDFIIVF